MMPCPFCGSRSRKDKVRIVASRKRILRKRVCTKCGARFVTKEVVTTQHNSIVTAKNYLRSCDYCAHQCDGKHYCNARGIPMKNMDTLTCNLWEAKPESAPTP